jgi:rhamnose utilization protein RhaD (predicted bifunctional aldolase and dehydrogenase)/NAD(P)-dependent dehydrogenase (short-subunit alcohol dehydrogenase family)
MDSLYTDEGARAAKDRYAAAHGEDLALRVYTSRLLGASPALVLHGGGNTSVKTTVTELLGDVTPVLYVKGSGSDLATIEPAGFPACRLAHLRRCCERASMTDEEMVAQLRGQMLDPGSPTPSVEALLHAFLPARFIDHTHADALLALVDQPRSEEIVREVYGDAALFVPYVMPGFALARKVAEIYGAHTLAGGPTPTRMILDKHGIFTWGDSARESYERMIESVSLAEAYRHARRGRGPAVAVPSGASGPANPASPASPASPDGARRITLALRGALARASGRSWIVRRRASDELLAFTRRGDLAEISRRGPVTPDHVIRTKALPLIVAPPEPDEGDAALAARVDRALEGYAEDYHTYFRRSVEARAVERAELDPFPRVILVPGIGALTAAASRKEADIAADIYERTASIIEAATALSSYQPVGELDLFDVEYWSLEQAKLGKGAPARPLSRRIALVTGGASGIGLGTARALLDAGAHVVLTDRDEAALARADRDLSARYPGHVTHGRCDVTRPADARYAVDLAIATFGGLDVVVSNAGTAPTGALHGEAGDAALRASIEVNLLGHQNIARAAVGVLLAQGAGGALLFNASKSAFNQGPDFGPYAVPKAALIALMRQYAVDLAPHRVRSNAVNADRIRTELFGGGLAEARARARGVSVDAYFQANLLARETTVDDVAQAFVYLATAQATTGCVITVDGGNAAAFPR